MYRIAAVLGGSVLIFFLAFGLRTKSKRIETDAGNTRAANTAPQPDPGAAFNPPGHAQPNGPPNNPTWGRPEQPKAQPQYDPRSKRPFDVDPQAKAAGQSIYLAFLTPFEFFTQGPWQLGVGKKGGDERGPIMVKNTQYKYGISLVPPDLGLERTRVSFAPGREFKRFKGWAGISDTPVPPSGTIVFKVYGDERKLWESQGITQSGTMIRFDIDITDVAVLTLQTYLTQGNCGYCHATWFDPWLER